MEAIVKLLHLFFIIHMEKHTKGVLSAHLKKTEIKS